MEPEYLSLFTNTGNFTIQVRFKDSDSSIATQTMKAEEIKKDDKSNEIKTNTEVEKINNLEDKLKVIEAKQNA